MRTLDVGGDKDLPGVKGHEEEKNPFLGWRGIRMSLDMPELFKPQLRAILRAAAAGNLKVMFPMVVDVEELRAARRILDECREELDGEGKEVGPLELGVMVETPAAAICAAELAQEVAFFSIAPTTSSSTPWPPTGATSACVTCRAPTIRRCSSS